MEHVHFSQCSTVGVPRYILGGVGVFMLGMYVLLG
jgi:hypothetical protein